MTNYVGRFAPTPSGPLHFGSMVAAVGSWLDAKAHNGRWILRMDDLDPPRVEPRAIDSILRTLEAYGLHWDGEVVYQSMRNEAYEDALSKLQQSGQTYFCQCTRKDLAGQSIYPGTCRDRTGVEARLVRLRAKDEQVEWVDVGLGPCKFRVKEAIGDVVLRNAHGLFSYHLANVVDDMHMGVTHVVRGEDLKEATVAHLYLQTEFQGPVIRYHHLGLAYDAQGFKLSKQTHAPAVLAERREDVLNQVFHHLGLPSVDVAAPETMLQSAVASWRSKIAPTL